MDAKAARNPGQKVKIDGTEYHLVLDMNSFCLLEEELEKRNPAKRNIFRAVNWQDPSLRDLVLIVWCAIMTHHPEITLEAFRENLTMEQLGELKPVIERMMATSNPPSEGGEKPQLTEEEKKSSMPQVSNG